MFAMFSRGASAIAKQGVNFRMMNEELQTGVGVMRKIFVQDWANDKFEDSKSNGKQFGVSDRVLESANQERHGLTDKDSRGFRAKGTKTGLDRQHEQVH